MATDDNGSCEYMILIMLQLLHMVLVSIPWDGCAGCLTTVTSNYDSSFTIAESLFYPYILDVNYIYVYEVCECT